MDSSRIRKDIVKEIVVETALDTKTVDAVISHQFALARQAIDKYNSIEISGWGKFVIERYHLSKRIDTQRNHILNMEKRRDELNTEGRVNYYQKLIDAHKILLDKMLIKLENDKLEARS